MKQPSDDDRCRAEAILEHIRLLRVLGQFAGEDTSQGETYFIACMLRNEQDETVKRFAKAKRDEHHGRKTAMTEAPALVPDWHKILVAYIGHVIDEESISFLPARVRGTAIETGLTEAERMALLAAEKEARDIRNNAEGNKP